MDVYQAHRFDHSTPLEKTMLAFADIVRQARPSTSGLASGRRTDPPGAALAKELRIPLVSNQPQYSAIYRVIEAEIVPASKEAGLSQIVSSPVAQGVLTGKYLPESRRPQARAPRTTRAASGR